MTTERREERCPALWFAAGRQATMRHRLRRPGPRGRGGRTSSWPRQLPTHHRENAVPYSSKPRCKACGRLHCTDKSHRRSRSRRRCQDGRGDPAGTRDASAVPRWSLTTGSSSVTCARSVADGKSTFIRRLCWHVVTGTPFLGERVKEGPVLCCTEERPGTTREGFERAGRRPPTSTGTGDGRCDAPLSGRRHVSAIHAVWRCRTQKGPARR